VWRLSDWFAAQVLRQVRQLRQHARRFSYTPPKGSGERDNSSFFSLLSMGAVVGCVCWFGVCMCGRTETDASGAGDSGIAYVYYDPDVLPASVKKWLPIQEPKGHGMSLEEYEKWRVQQGGLPTTTAKKEEEAAASDSDDNVEPPSMEGTMCASTALNVMVELMPCCSDTADIPIPHGDVPPEEMKASLEKLLTEARENEAAFIADLKKTRTPVSDEDKQMVRGCDAEATEEDTTDLHNVNLCSSRRTRRRRRD
jgi:hypothetical protein